jgi:hypothetical protein
VAFEVFEIYNLLLQVSFCQALNHINVLLYHLLFCHAYFQTATFHHQLVFFSKDEAQTATFHHQLVFESSEVQPIATFHLHSVFECIVQQPIATL